MASDNRMAAKRDLIHQGAAGYSDPQLGCLTDEFWEASASSDQSNEPVDIKPGQAGCRTDSKNEISSSAMDSGASSGAK
jgi:hypothetical protein